MNVLIDPCGDARTLRRIIYRGGVIVLTRLDAVTALTTHIRAELTTLFAPHDPEHAHEHFSREAMAELLGEWKPRFMHSQTARSLTAAVIREAGFDAETTHFDIPKPRTAFPVGHLTTGIAYAFPWHRDTWYAAPRQQVNWWLPVFPVREDNAMSFDASKFVRSVPNSSSTFDYYRNNVARLSTASQVNGEHQPRPAAVGHTPAHESIVLPAPGSVLLFSGAHLHRSIPNTSGRARYSVDFRTVDATDLAEDRGAPSLDVFCTGTAIRDFRRVVDDRPFDEDLVLSLFAPPPDGAMLVFSPSDPSSA